MPAEDTADAEKIRAAYDKLRAHHARVEAEVIELRAEAARIGQLLLGYESMRIHAQVDKALAAGTVRTPGGDASLCENEKPVDFGKRADVLTGGSTGPGVEPT